ncbi:MAG: pyruvate ferredoxin oxidoreductase [Candidatus Lokiarchaeota archaeon]|nr:pyruvate ferredoxin oxidoreductase [Candidatus Lokiarchaeota archaeon]MBD3199345.1 pyruvate ferredoxin oxidoreductase [Candidatus Lokiarchaeota archaeon]
MTEAEQRDFIQKKESKILKGNIAAAYAAKSARVQVISAYPITPQTTVVEKLSEFVDGGLMPGTQYIKVESEHSVMASIVGASIAGTRTFTATSGQGLFYMNEMIHWAAGARLPIVTTLASRGPAPPWNIWADYFDVINARDTGWMSAFCSTHQEIYDEILMSYKVTENPDVMLPKFVAYGGFVLSHTSKPVMIEEQDLVDKFLPPLPDEEGWEHIFIDPERPMMHGNLIMPSGFYMEFRMKIHDAMVRAKEKIKKVAEEFERMFGRSYGNGLVQEYKLDGADVGIVIYGDLALQMEQAVDELRDEGYKVGMLKLRYFRPFPEEDIRKAAKKVKVLGVVDRATAFGSPTGGPVSSEVKSTLHNSGIETKVLPMISGLGGREVTLEQQKDQLKILVKMNETGELPDDLLYGTLWHGKLEVE